MSKKTVRLVDYEVAVQVVDGAPMAGILMGSTGQAISGQAWVTQESVSFAFNGNTYILDGLAPNIHARLLAGMPLCIVDVNNDKLIPLAIS